MRHGETCCAWAFTCLAALPAGSGRPREEEVECMQNEAVQERKSSEWGKWRYGLSVLHAENIHPQAAGTELLI